MSPLAPPDDLVELGRVAGAYGVRGWLKLRPHGRADESALLAVGEAWARMPGSPEAPETPDWQRIELAEARPHADVLLLRIAGCDDREQAARFKGAVVAVSRSCFPEPAPGEYYWVDLVGCDVVGHEGVVLGRVLAVEDYGAPHPVLRVVGAEGREQLIPFVDPVVGEVDLVAKRITADWAADY